MIKFSLLFRRILLALALMALVSNVWADDPEGWKVGVARRAITPKEPIWMAGYAARKAPSQGAVHDLWAKAMAMEDADGHRAVLVTLDLCGIDRESSMRVRTALNQAKGLRLDQIVLACSHTHSGPVTGTNLLGMYPVDEAQKARIVEYTRWLEQTIVEVASEAVDSLKPGSLRWGMGTADFAVNRRENPEAQVPDLRAKVALKGPVDHSVPVLVVSDAAGKTLGIVFGYACHCTTLDGPELCGDYAGFAQVAIEQAHPGTTAMFVAGCGGDQNPIPRRSMTLAEQYGQELAAAVSRVVKQPMRPVSGPLVSKYQEVDLAFAAIPGREQWEQEAKSDQIAVANRAKAMLATLDREGSIAGAYPYPVEVWRLGTPGEPETLTWIFLGGEVTVDYALRFQRNLGSSRTWVSAYCNDVMAYIPSLRVLKEGGYEGGGAMVYYGQPGPWSEQVEEQIAAAVAELTGTK